MTAARENRTGTTPFAGHTDSRRAWTRPAVERIEAGSAEVGSDTASDAGVTKS